MLRSRAVAVSPWKAVLLPEVLRLPEELAEVDARMWPSRPTRALLAKAIRRIASPADGSRPRVARPAPACGTEAGRRASGHTGSPRSSGCAQPRDAMRRSPPCSGSLVSSRDWPTALPVTPTSSW